MGLISRIKEARMKGIARQEAKAQESRVAYAERKGKPSRFERIQKAIENRAYKTTQIPIPTKRATKEQTIRYLRRRRAILNSIGAVVPINRSNLQKRNRRIKYGQGRPRESYKYFIPGKGKVDVFTWRKYLSQQKAILRQQLQQQISQQRVAQREYARQGGYIAQEQIQMPSQYPEYPQQSIPVQVTPPSLKSISILDRTGVNLSNNGDNTFIEQDLISGAPKQRRIGNLW